MDSKYILEVEPVVLAKGLYIVFLYGIGHGEKWIGFAIL